MDVASAMDRLVHTISPSADLATAARRMADAGTGYLLAVDIRGRAVGILTRQDLEARIPIVHLQANPDGTGVVQDQAIRRLPVAQAMSTRLVCVHESDGVDEAAAIMAHHRISHLPVMRGAKAVGMLHRSHLDAVRPALPEPALIATA